jgi:hypothetical protein
MKTKFIRPVLNCILCAGLMITCARQEYPNEVIQIRYGTTFGFCLGYCKKDLTLKSGSETFQATGWLDTIPIKTCTESLDNSTWDSLRTGMDIKSFFNLPVTIGCPDCADGGAEWIEVGLNNTNIHKVTFEYWNEPAELKNYVTLLRNTMENAEICFTKH